LNSSDELHPKTLGETNMANISDNATNDRSFNTLVTAVKTTVLNGVKKSFLSIMGLALVLMLQVTFFGSEAIASPFSGIGNQVDKMTQGVKTDMAIDKAAGITKEIGRDLRDGRTDKVIDKVAETSKDFAKEAGNRAKELAKNVKDGTKENIGKAKDMAKDAKDNIGDGVDKAKEVTDEVKDGAKDLPDKAGNKVEEAIDSVKNFLGQ
jgi:gas vesicle protein